MGVKNCRIPRLRRCAAVAARFALALAAACAAPTAADQALDDLVRQAAASDPAEDPMPTLALAYAHCDREDTAQGLRVLDAALLRTAAHPSRTAHATLAYARGQLHFELGDAATALPDLETALSTLRSTPEADPSLRLACAMALAAALSDVGELVQAAAGLDEVLADPAAADWEGRRLALGNLSDLRRRLGDHTAAVAAASEALAAVPAGAALDRAFAQAVLARALDAAAGSTGDEARSREAEALLRQGLQELADAEPADPQTSSLRALLQQNLCSSLFHRGALDEALPLSRAVVDALPHDTTRPEAVRVLSSHASLLASTGEVAEARRFFARAVRLATQQIDAVASSGSDRALFARHLELRSLLSSVLSCRTAFVPDPNDDREDLEAVLAARGLAERRAARTQRLAAAALRDARIAAEWRDLQGRATVHGGGGAAHAAAIERAVFDRRQAGLLRACGGDVEALADVAGAAAALAEDAVLLVTQTYERAPMARRGASTGRGEDHVAAFVLRRDASVVRIELGRADTIRSGADALRSRLRSGRADVRGRAPGRPAAEAPGPDLAAMLRPLLEVAHRAPGDWVVCPDDALASVPWAALSLPDGRAVIEAHAVTYVDHPEALRPSPQATTRTELLAVGDCDFSPIHGSEGLSPLPGSARELELAARTFGQRHPDRRATVLRRADATWNAFARAAERAGFVHLSTHGVLAREELWPRVLDARFPAGLVVADDPLAQLAIAFSAADGADGRVPASRFATLDLSGCRLAVLACCDSNAGPRTFGEALSGLTAAARAAGARSVVGTLWPIPDEESAKLLQWFYEACWDRDVTPGEALVLAQRRARAEGLPASCWAAFVHSGPWRDRP